MAVALIPGMAAREVAVAALGTVYAVGGDDEVGASLGQLLADQWSLATALSFLAWYVFAPQCVADPGRGEARDQRLDLADGDVRLHDRPGLSGLVRDLPHRRGDGGGVGPNTQRLSSRKRVALSGTQVNRTASAQSLVPDSLYEPSGMTT